MDENLLLSLIENNAKVAETKVTETKVTETKMTETKGVGKWQVSERWPDLPGWLPVRSPAH